MYPQRLSGLATRAAFLDAEQLARVMLFAALTGMGAIIRIPLSPVPVTMQVFFVLLSGMVLGPVWGPASQVAYIAMGLCGAPFFAAPPYAGPAVLLGPTGGYLLGFVLASAAVGYASRRLVFRSLGRGSGSVLSLACAGLLGIAVIYASGAAWLGSWLSVNGMDLSLVIDLGVKPFIAADLAKAVLAALSVGLPVALRRG